MGTYRNIGSLQTRTNLTREDLPGKTLKIDGHTSSKQDFNRPHKRTTPHAPEGHSETKLTTQQKTRRMCVPKKEV